MKRTSKLKGLGAIFIVQLMEMGIPWISNFVEHAIIKRRFAKSSGFQNIRHTSRTIKGIETIQAIYKKRRSLESDSVFSVYKELQQLVAIA